MVEREIRISKGFGCKGSGGSKGYLGYGAGDWRRAKGVEGWWKMSLGRLGGVVEDGDEFREVERSGGRWG